jgi:hypothetical protein
MRPPLRPTLESFLWRGDEPLAGGELGLAGGVAALEGVNGHYALHTRGSDGVHRRRTTCST